MEFNKELALSNGGKRFAIAFDPCFISKSGKKTPGISWYWSGCAGQAKRGLEIGGIAAIDIDNHTAFHLEAVQTMIENKESTTLTQWYIDIIQQRVESLLAISPYLVADAWFSKKPFVDAITGMGMHFICRFRDDAVLKYHFKGLQSKGKGRPKKYAGKIDPKNIDNDYFELVSQCDETIVHSAIVYSNSLKCDVKLVHVTYIDKNGKKTIKLYYCTDTQCKALDILEYYQSRFQIEFLYRDGKQFTGFDNSQSRSQNKMNFHFNTSLTAINIAKIEHWLSVPKDQRKSFSMSDVKTMNHNRLLINRFFDVFGINPYSTKNQNYVKELIYYGTIAA
jgi:hypothetical protein